MTKDEAEAKAIACKARLDRLRAECEQLGVGKRDIDMVRRQHAALLRALAAWNGGSPALRVIQGGKSSGPPATPAPSSSA